MDHHAQQEARVWSRVMASSEQARDSASACPTAETLMALIREELADACVYRYLAGRVCCPGDRETLLCLAKEEQAHARQLSAAYFVLTGKKACPGKPEHPCVTCVAETLRQQYFGDLPRSESGRAGSCPPASVRHGHQRIGNFTPPPGRGGTAKP